MGGCPLSNAALEICLSAAVPLWIDDLKQKGGPDDRDRELAQEYGSILAEKGDVLQFGGKKGEAADLFNKLAHAVAVLAFQPGGIRVFGMEFKAC